MKDKIFGVLQRVGRSFMLPIALLPVAGLLLGIGSSFTNETMLAAYGLNNVIHPGTLIYTILDVMSQTGNAVFNNLALLFAMGVAIGMARKEKEVAALSGAVAYIIMNTAIQAMINAAGGVEAMPANSTTTMLGITTLQMGVFGGIVVGLGVAALHNKFYKIELPQVLAFFGGTRFVPIVSSIVYLVVGIAMFYIWPVVQSGIAALGALVLASGYAGTFIYGLLERALIPFGLHHVFYMPFWQTAVGGTAIIDGVTVTGAQNIFFAELASKSTTVFSVSATRFMAGKFPFMMFGLPGAALAMYQCAKPEKKKVAGGLLLSAALTAFLTGITEPLEHIDGGAFKFVAPGSALNEVEKICADTEDMVTVTQGKRHLMFEAGNTQLICRRLEGEFLDYRNAIPTNNPICLEVDNKTMIESLERVSVVISEKLKSPVRCLFSADKVYMSARTGNGEARDICPVRGDGQELEIGFNNRYLMDALRYAPADTVKMHLNTGISPCIITPVDDSDNFIYMVLPVRLKAQ